MVQNKTLRFLILAATVGVWGVASGCGSHKDQDLAEGAKPAPAQPQETGGFVVKPQQGGENAQPAAASCAVELKQEVIINPQSSGKTAVFSGKVGKDCGKDGKKAILYIQSPAEFKIGPEFGCFVNQGSEYNVRCSGSGLKVSDEGVVSITIAGDSKFDSAPIKMRVAYE